MPAAGDPPAPGSLRERLGGRWAISWQMVAISSPIAVLSVIAGEPQATSSLAGFVRWTLVASASALVVCGVWLVWNATAFRHRRVRPVPVWLTVVAYASTGAVLSLALGIGIDLLGLTTSMPLGERIVINSFIAVWWSIAFALFLSYRDDARTARAALIEQAVQVELSTIQQDAFVAALQEQLRAQVDESLQEARRELEPRVDAMLPSSDAAAPAAEWDDVAEMLRTTSRDAVRPLSKRLWHQAEEQYPHTRWWSVLANIVRSEPLQPLLMSLITILASVSSLVRTFGVAGGFTLLGINIAIIVVVCAVINPLMRAQPRWHASLFVTGVVALEVLTVAALALREAWLPGSVTIALVVAQVVASIILVFAASGVMSWRDSAQRANRIFSEEIAAERIASIARSRQVAQLTREVGRALHGSVQSRLEACAMVIDNANAVGDERMLNLALHEALAILSAPIPERPVAPGVAEEIDRKVSMWGGLCDITVSVDVAQHPPARQVAAVGMVVEEAVANAIRRGEATHVSVRAQAADQGAIDLTIDDNGLGPGSGNPGVGSALIGQATAGAWSLTALPQGSRLSATVPAL